MLTKVVFILGSGYSGSTLLDLILGSHSRMIGLGEIHAKAFDPFIAENQLCTCLFKARDCHFWTRVMTRLRDLTGQESFRLTPLDGDQQAIVQNTADFFRAIKEVSSAEILVDSSKRTRRAHMLVESGLFEPKIIHLVRDGRGVGHSHFKRGWTFKQGVSQWRDTNAAILEWLESSNTKDHIRLKYEDFCARPIDSVRRICDFIGVEWEPEMMNFGRTTHHNVKGNPMRFNISASAIKLDETWKDHLTTDDLNLFEVLAGDVSERLGYPRKVRATVPVAESHQVSSDWLNTSLEGQSLGQGY